MLAFDKLNKTSVWYKQTGPKSIQPITYMSHLQKKKNLNQIALPLELGFSISLFFLLSLFLFSFFQFFIEVKNDI